MNTETTPTKSTQMINSNPSPPIIKKNHNPNVIVRGTLLATIIKKNDHVIMEIDTAFATTNVKIDNAERLHHVDHLDQFKVCLTYSFNRVTNEIKIFNQFHVSKIYIKYLIENDVSPISSVKRRLDMDAALENDNKKLKD